MSDTTSPSTTKLVLEGIAGTLPPSRDQRGDIEFGWPLLQQVVELQIGSAMAVRERDVIAVEATEGTPFSFTFAANTFGDADGDPLTYTAQLSGGGALPAWLSFDGATRTFSGTPASLNLTSVCSNH